MKIKEFLQDKTLTAVDIIDEHNILINLYIEVPTPEDIVTCIIPLDADTSNVIAYTPVIMHTDFIFENDIIQVNEHIFDTNEINVKIPR